MMVVLARKLTIAVLAALVLAGCSSEPVEQPPVRFEKITSFKVFDEEGSANGYIIRDLHRPQFCYFWLRYGGANGGAAMTPTWCDNFDGSARARFEKVKRFSLFDEQSEGFIIRDLNNPKHCFFWLVDGMASGGAAMEPVACDA